MAERLIPDPINHNHEILNAESSTKGKVLGSEGEISEVENPEQSEGEVTADVVGATAPIFISS